MVYNVITVKETITQKVKAPELIALENLRKGGRPMDSVKRRSVKAFTLLELVIVIAIIAVLAAIIIPAIAQQTKDAKMRAANDNAQSIYNATQEFLNDLQQRNEDAKAYFGTDGVLRCAEMYPGVTMNAGAARANIPAEPSGSRKWERTTYACNQIRSTLSADFQGTWIVAVYPETYTVKYVVCTSDEAKGGDDAYTDYRGSVGASKFDYSSVKSVFSNPFTEQVGGSSNRSQEYYCNTTGVYVGQYPINAAVVGVTYTES